MHTLEQLVFDNAFARLPDTFHARVLPTPVPDPYLVCHSADACRLIGLDPAQVERPAFVETFAGNRLLPGMEPLAACYAGHQFGHYVAQLGDGRAILLGEVNGWEIQIKGGGRTPFSRGGDGRAVLRSSIREFLCSEAMHALGIPTTRALALVGSDRPVYREEVESAALVTRLAPSFVRFGSFEVFYHRGQTEPVRQLADHVIARHFPALTGRADPYPAFLAEVARRTAELIAAWQAVGFAHGVLNTDNMSILGLTLDYGPFGFLDAFDPGFVCNHSDSAGRYAFDQQPDVGAWNLTRLAQALVPLMSVDAASDAIAAYPRDFTAAYLARMAAKFGLPPHPDTTALMLDAFALLAADGVDYTIFFRRLCDFDSDADAGNAALAALFRDRAAFSAWARRYAAALRRHGVPDAARRDSMRAVNPKYVLRNHLAEIAIRRAVDARDFSEVARLHTLLAHPFDEQPQFAAYAAAPPAWAKEIAVSCSS